MCYRLDGLLISHRYPKQQRLLKLKKASVNEYALPPLHLPFSELKSLHGSKFDVILIDPPFSSTFTWDHLQEINIPSLAGDPSFVFLWVGSGAGEGLERGREVLAKWGYRRCEDVVWVKTNKTTNRGPGMDPPTTSLLTRTKQHCLMGIRGTVRRSTDSWFVHCNVGEFHQRQSLLICLLIFSIDTDVIIWEGDPVDPTRKPPEMYTLIENFCLGFRRLEVFGKLSSLRRGWVTALAPGQEEHLPANGSLQVEEEEGGLAARWSQESWEEGIRQLAANSSAVTSGNNTNIGISKPVVPMSAEIDSLRPKSPVRGGQGNNQHNHNNSNGSNNISAQQQTMAMSMSGPARFSSGGGGANRGANAGFANLASTPMNMQNQMMGQNALVGQPMMGMNGMGMGMGMGNMDDFVGGWTPMMGPMGGMGVGTTTHGAVGGMGASGTGLSSRTMNAGGLPGMGAHGMGMAGTGNMASGMGAAQGLNGIPMHMMNQMGMGTAFGGQGAGGVGGGNFGSGGMQMFNGPAGMNAWAGDQSQFGMEGGWVEGDGRGMMGANMPGMLGGMGMGNMNMGGMGMNQQWGGSGNY